ncbi:MAG: hypothetical protein DCC52_06645 [Chloroflexi bacterium]|nr:MAG: hypothetical protein DCC52_06645 [Chloroflexota bacterium]
MTSQKKASAIVLALIGIISVVFTLLTIIGVWWFAATFNAAVVTVLSAVERGAQNSSAALQQVDSSVSGVQSEVNALETRVLTVGVNVSENPVILNALRQQYDERVSPETQALVETARAARSALDSTASMASAANSNPFTAMFVPDFSRVQTLNTALNEVEQELMRVGLELRDLKVDATQAVTGGITGRLQRVDNALQSIRALTNELNASVAALGARAAALQQSIPFWVNVVAFGLTLIMLAAIVGGIALAWSSISYLQSGGARMDTFLGKFRADAA